MLERLPHSRRRGRCAIALVVAGLALASVGCGSEEESSGESASGSAAQGLTKIDFQVDFVLSGWDAPFYLALDRGYYEDENLDVAVHEGTGSTAGLKTLIGGRNQIVLADRATMAVQNANGGDFVSVMGIVNTSPQVLVSYKDKGITAPQDLEGKTVGVAIGSYETAILPAFLELNDIDPDSLSLENVASPQKAQFLKSGRLDVIGYIDYSAVSIAPLDELNLLHFGDFGMSMIGNGLIATREWAAENGDTVRAFIRATARGFEDAIEDPEAAIDSLLERAPTLPRDVALQQLTLSLEGLEAPGGEGEPIGYQTPESWNGTIESLSSAGLVEEGTQADDFYTNDYVSDAG
jgi:NitT/TauT family transport system substrate-binding protein